MLHPQVTHSIARKFAHKFHINRKHSTLDREIDYENPIVYAVVDSALSLPCERNSVVIINDVKTRTRRENRREEYEAYRSLALGKVAKGEVDEALSLRLKDANPAFMNLTRGDSMECSPTGYPCTSLGLPVSGNHISGEVLNDVSRGAGSVIVG